MIHVHYFDFTVFPSAPGPCECGMEWAAFERLFRRAER